MLTNLFLALGLNRDHWAFLVGKILSLATLITSGVIDLTYWAAQLGIHITPVGVHWIQVVAVAVLYLSGQFSTSSLPAKKIAMLLLACVLGASLSACGPASVKQQIDRDDRVAFESLRTFQTLESGAYHAKLPWPTAAQHQAIGAKLSTAYTLVIDVANAGLVLKTGVPASAQLITEAATLAKLVSEIVDLAKLAPVNVSDAAAKAQTTTTALVTHVTGGK